MAEHRPSARLESGQDPGRNPFEMHVTQPGEPGIPGHIQFTDEAAAAAAAKRAADEWQP